MASIIEKKQRKSTRFESLYKFLVENKVTRLLIYTTVIFLTFNNYYLRKHFDELSTEMLVLKTQNANLVRIVLDKNTDYDKVDIAFWWKLKRGNRYIPMYVNKFYETAFLKHKGIDRSDYVGRLDNYTHTSEQAKLYNYNDSIVAHTGVPYFGKEPAVAFGKPIGNLWVYKERRIIDKDTIVYGVGVIADVTEHADSVFGKLI